MTDKQFHILLSAALTAESRDAYISEWALSSIWEDAEGADIPADRAEQVAAIWDLAHLTIRQIREHTGLTQAAFGERFFIPGRTVQNWERGENECPVYTRLLLAQAVGLCRVQCGAMSRV